MKPSIRSIALVAGLGVLVAAGRAQNLDILIIDSLGHSLEVDSSSAANISGNLFSIVIDPNVLLTSFDELNVDSEVSASMGFANGVSPSYVSDSITLSQDAITDSVSFSVLVSANGFVLPSGPRFLSAAFSGNFTNAPTSTNALFQASADPNNVLDTPTVYTPTFSVNSTGLLPNSFATDLTSPTFTGQPFSMTTNSALHLNFEALVQSNGIVTAATAAPEPAAIALLAMGAISLIRRRRN